MKLIENNNWMMACKSYLLLYTSHNNLIHPISAPTLSRGELSSVKNNDTTFYFSKKTILPPTHSLSLLYRTPIIFPLLMRARFCVATGLASPSFQK